MLMSDGEQSAEHFRIDRDGQWYHNGDPIHRKALAKLFSDKGLKRDENGAYWLASPYEKYPVQVDDVPFVITDYREESGSFVFTSNMDEDVILSAQNPFILRDGIPYIEIRNGLEARIGRSVFYHLVNQYGSEITSGGQCFSLGDEA